MDSIIEEDKIYPKFRISSVYDFLECEKRFYLIETGKITRMLTVKMMRGRKEHSEFEEKVMELPPAFEMIDLKDGFLKALKYGKQIISSETPVKIHDHEFKLFISGKVDAVEIIPQENLVKVIENKPRLSDYAVVQGLLYGYAVKSILSQFNPRIFIEIRNTKSQEILSRNDYYEKENEDVKKILDRISLLLHNKLLLSEMKSCRMERCQCSKIF